MLTGDIFTDVSIIYTANKFITVTEMTKILFNSGKYPNMKKADIREYVKGCIS